MVIRKKPDGVKWDRHCPRGLTRHRGWPECRRPRPRGHYRARPRVALDLKWETSGKIEREGGKIHLTWNILRHHEGAKLPSSSINKNVRYGPSSQTSNLWTRKCLKGSQKKILETVTTACEINSHSSHCSSMASLSFALLVKSWFPVLIQW